MTWPTIPASERASVVAMTRREVARATRITESMRAGWVAPADYGEWWQVTDAGRAVLEVGGG